jgi:hypothetical protein
MPEPLKLAARPPDRPDVECFYHEGVAAVGSCRSCFRGLCRSCAVELEAALACRNRCEESAAAVAATVNQSVRYQSVSGGLLRSARGLWLGLTFVSGVVGLFVLVWGLALPDFREVSLLGVPFLALAFLTARLARNVRLETRANE